jgi:hypothetical protein
MKILIRIGSLAALVAFTALRLWLAVLGLALIVGLGWAIAVAVSLLLLRLIWPLQIAVFCGALMVWHWPLALAVIVAAPRLILTLPGLISTFLATKRHPRPRWSTSGPAGSARQSHQAIAG